MICPACGHENIPGADVCDECLQPLVDDVAPAETSPVERRILESPVNILSPAEPICVEADQSVASTLALMDERRIGCILVIDEGRLAGIFTERDAIMKLDPQSATWADAPVRDFMTSDPETVDVTASVAFALHKMDLGGYRHLPVLDEEARPTGVISVRDILRFLTEEYAAVDKT